MKIFWFFSPFLVVTFVIDVIFLPESFLKLVGGGLTIIVLAAVFFVVFRLAKVNREASLEREEFKSIVSGLSDAVVAYDENFKIIFFNHIAENLFKINSSSILGKTVSPGDVENSELRVLVQVIFPSLAPRLIPRSPSGIYPQIADLHFEDPPLELRVSTSPISEKGKVSGFLKIIRDRTQEVAYYRSKSEFITLASHQLHTPINEINWGLEFLIQDKSLSPETQGIVQRSFSAARKLLALVEDLLNVSKIEAGGFGYSFEDTDIVIFLNDILGAVLPQAEKVGVKVFFNRPPEVLPKIKVDPKKLSIAVVNLLDNAIRYNIKNGEVVVSVQKRSDGPFIQVSVKDTGIGIPPKDIDKIFTKFFRAENALKFETEGSGLGLYIAKNIVQAHGGQMWVESELNRGSIFYFTLPTDPSLIPPKEVPLEF